MDKELINNAMAPIYDKLVSIDNKLDSLMMLSGLFMIANNNLVPEEQRMQALNKAKITMNISLIGVIIKLLTLTIFSLVHIGLYSLVISEITNIFFVVFANLYYLKKEIK